MLRFEPRCARAAQTPLGALLFAATACHQTADEHAASVAVPAFSVCPAGSVVGGGPRSWAATGPVAEALGNWLRQGEADGQVVVPSCEPRVACGPLLSVSCEWPRAEGAAVRAATWWSCAELPPIQLTVSSLCDDNASCVTRVVDVLRKQPGLERWRVTDDFALRVNGLELVSNAAGADARTVLVTFQTLRGAFQSARAFRVVTTQLEACGE